MLKIIVPEHECVSLRLSKNIELFSRLANVPNKSSRDRKILDFKQVCEASCWSSFPLINDEIGNFYFYNLASH